MSLIIFFYYLACTKFEIAFSYKIDIYILLLALIVNITFSISLYFLMNFLTFFSKFIVTNYYLNNLKFANNINAKIKIFKKYF